MEIKNQEQEQTEKNNVYTKKSMVRYRNSELEIKDADDIRSDDVMQEHSMVFTESEDIGSKIQESKRQERYSSKVWNPVAFYSEKSECRVCDIEQCKKHRNEFQEQDDGLV